MNKLQELINRLSPNGIEYKKLEDVCVKFKGMTGVSGKWQETGNCCFIDYLNAYKHLKIDITDKPKATVSRLDQNTLKQGDIICTSASETPDECAISSVIEGEIEDGVFLDDHLFGIRVMDFQTVNPSFLNYYLRSKEARAKINKTVRGATRFYISTKEFLKIEVPVPPLEVQREIVRILDDFTELTAQLTAELIARKKQFDHYLNSLFGRNSDEAKLRGKLCRLSDIGEFQRGKRFCHRDDCEDGISAIHYGELYTHYGISADKARTHISNSLGKKMRYAEKNDVIIVGAGENRIDIGVGVAWLGEGKVAIHDACYRFRTDQNPKFISYYLRSTYYHNQIFGKVSEGKICALSSDAIGSSLIGLPSLKEQQYIVEILDKFDAYCNSLTKGLPAEIDARQKQYEYYRDSLLTFKRLSD